MANALGASYLPAGTPAARGGGTRGPARRQVPGTMSPGQFPGPRAVDDPRAIGPVGMNPAIQGNALADVRTADTGKPAVDPYAAYQANFAKGMAASRGHLAAAYGAALGEINANKEGGLGINALMPAKYNAINDAGNAAIHASDRAADASSATTGIRSFQSAAHTSDPIIAAGDMANAASVNSAPMIAQGVQANALAAKNQAEQQRQEQAMQLDAQENQFRMQLEEKRADKLDADRNRAEDRAWQLADETTRFNRERSLRGPADLTPAEQRRQQSLNNEQESLDKASVHSFTADDLPHLRGSATYAQLAAGVANGVPVERILGPGALSDPTTQRVVDAYQWDTKGLVAHYKSQWKGKSKSKGGSTNALRGSLQTGPQAGGTWWGR